jgi:hypothetical protein
MAGQQEHTDPAKRAALFCGILLRHQEEGVWRRGTGAASLPTGGRRDGLSSPDGGCTGNLRVGGEEVGCAGERRCWFPGGEQQQQEAAAMGKKEDPAGDERTREIGCVFCDFGNEKSIDRRRSLGWVFVRPINSCVWLVR